MTKELKPRKYFWFIGVLGLIWNFIKALDYLSQVYNSQLNEEHIPYEQMDFITNVPIWASAAFAIAVWFGLAASIFLLARNKVAYTLFVISFIAILIQIIYNAFSINIIDTYGKVGAAQSIFTIAVGLFLMLFSKKAKKVGIID
tara:strand:- start:559 stop:990 length:432 start_codon:yes stop_codon:yes gene_type:complete